MNDRTYRIDYRHTGTGRRLPRRTPACKEATSSTVAKRRSSSFNTGCVDHLYLDPHLPNVRFFMHFGDVTDATNLIRLVQQTQPDEIYNLAAQSHVMVSFETASNT